MRLYKITSLLIMLMILFIDGCAARKSILETPLRYGKEFSRDSVEFKIVNFKTLSEAILKVNGEQRERIFYKVDEVSINSFRIEQTESTAYYEFRPSIDYRGVSPAPLTVFERKRSFNIDVKIIDQQTIIMKADKGQTLATAKGIPFKPNFTYYIMQSCRPGEVCGGYQKTPADIAGLDEMFTRLSSSPQPTEMNERELAYYFKDFILLVEGNLPK